MRALAASAEVSRDQSSARCMSLGITDNELPENGADLDRTSGAADH